MLQNAKVTAFTVFELLKENQQGERGAGGGGVKLLPYQIRVNRDVVQIHAFFI